MSTGPIIHIVFTSYPPAQESEKSLDECMLMTDVGERS